MDNFILCPHCGYDLQGLDRTRCPECGEAFDPEELRVSQIPWSHRDRIGRFLGYWRTVWMVTFRNRQFMHEMNTPVSYRDAQLFRWMTIALLFGTFLPVTGVLYALEGFRFLDTSILALAAWEAVWPVPLAYLLVLLYLAMITGVQSYWFHPRSIPVARQNRAVALSYYACAPPGWTPITVLAFSASVTSYNVLDNIWGYLVVTLGALLISLQLLIWWWVQVRMYVRATDRSVGSVVAFTLALPLCWTALGVLMLAAIPASVAYVAIYIVSHWQG